MPDQPDRQPPADIDEALFMLQQNPPRLVKNRDGQVGNQRTRYADLGEANDVILPRLCELGLLWVTGPDFRMLPDSGEKDGPKFVLDWEMKHVPSGTSRRGVYPLPAGANPMQNGSAITYARRYALIAVTNTVADDDDDDGAGYQRRGMAQRATARQQPRDTARRADGPAPRAERARPVQQPALPEPAARQDTPAGEGGRVVSEPMRRKLFAQLREAGITGDDRVAIIADMLGRPIASSNEIGYDEMRGVLDAFDKALEQDPETAAATVIDIYRRTTGTLPADPPADPAPAKAARPRARKQQPPAAPDTRSREERTRDAVAGRPPQPGDPTPPWEEPPTLDAGMDWPEPAPPGSGGDPT